MTKDEKQFFKAATHLVKFYTQQNKKQIKENKQALNGVTACLKKMFKTPKQTKKTVKTVKSVEPVVNVDCSIYMPLSLYK
jgi:hypothetical protein